jgi:hypothetical protein
MGHNDHMEDVPLTKVQAGFIQWLRKNKYENASECCPWDGEYIGAEEAIDLVETYISEEGIDDDDAEDLREFASGMEPQSNAFADPHPDAEKVTDKRQVTRIKIPENF